MTTLTLRIPGPLKGRRASEMDWLTSNMRLHNRVRDDRIARLRTLAAVYARVQRLEPVTTTVNVLALVSYPTRAHADAHNAQPTVKAAIDGLVDAGILAGDFGCYVHDVTFRRGPITGERGTYQLTLELTEQTA